MSAYELLLLNTSIPQIQAAQSGDTYVCPRDIAFSAALTLSAGTANGVPYLNGSKVVTTGSALVFDGTNLGVNTTPLGGGRISTIGDFSAVNGVVIQDSATTYANNDWYLLLRNSSNNAIAGLSHPAANSLGIWGNDDIRFLISGAQTEQMRLTSTGLGIGTNSITDKLTAQGTIRATDGTNYAQFANNFLRSYASGTFYFDNATVGQSFVYRVSGASSLDTTALTLNSSGNLGLGVTPSEKLDVQTSGGRFQVQAYGAGSVMLNSDGAMAYKAATVGHQFFNASTQAMTLDASGNLLVGTTSQTLGTARLSVDSSGLTVVSRSTASTEAPYASFNSATSGNNQFVWFYTGDAGQTFRGSIEFNRAGGLVAYNTTSDYRSKDIIGPLANSGAIIDALKVYEGKMKGATQSRPMLVAHEAQEHAPYAVTGEKDAVNKDGTPKYQQMDVSSLVPLLLAEIQSLRARVAQLEGK